MKSEKIKVLYFLENKQSVLLEIKRLCRQNEPDKSKVFFWLLIHKHPQKIKKLTFLSMKSENNQEERTFREGRLKFNDQNGVFKTTDREEIFENKTTGSFPLALQKSILQWLERQ